MYLDQHRVVLDSNITLITSSMITSFLSRLWISNLISRLTFQDIAPYYQIYSSDTWGFGNQIRPSWDLWFKSSFIKSLRVHCDVLGLALSSLQFDYNRFDYINKKYYIKSQLKVMDLKYNYKIDFPGHCCILLDILIWYMRS